MVNQLFSNPSVMLLSAAVLGLLGFGARNAEHGIFAVHCRIARAGTVDTRTRTKAPAEPKPVKMAENNTVVEATWNDVQLEDSLGMEVGYRLIPMVDFQQDGELLGRIRSIRKKFAGDGISAASGAHSRQYGSATCPLSHFDERRGDWQW